MEQSHQNWFQKGIYTEKPPIKQANVNWHIYDCDGTSYDCILTVWSNKQSTIAWNMAPDITPALCRTVWDWFSIDWNQNAKKKED